MPRCVESLMFSYHLHASRPRCMQARVSLVQRAHTHTLIQAHKHARTHACTHPHTHTHIHTSSHVAHTCSACMSASHARMCTLRMRDKAGRAHEAHPTPIFNVPVSAKKGSLRHWVVRDLTSLPPSLQCWGREERSGLAPAKKDSLSARADLHRHLNNIEEKGEG